MNRRYDNSEGLVASIDGECAGVLSYDGETWRQHLVGACATHVSAAPDGNVWATVMDVDPAAFSGDGPDLQLDPDRPPAGIYVITPEAVAAAE